MLPPHHFTLTHEFPVTDIFCLEKIFPKKFNIARRMTQGKEWLINSILSRIPPLKHTLASLSCVIWTSSPCGTWAM